ncbi:MAG: hypothetical protein C4551_10770 [Bacillota bacterium]|nr:MAG: hypothetical protein C4551_10770 [Bacillota bacterium]
MAHEIPVENVTLIAGADLSASQYLAVKINASGQAILAGAGENAVGILQNKPASGQAAEVMALGISKVVYGATVTAGQNLAADAAGKLVPASGDNAVIGVALEGGSADEIRSALLVTRVTAGARTSSILAIPVKLAKVAAGDVVTTYTPGFGGKIVKVSFLVTDPVTTAAKAATLNLEIGTTDLTGGVLSLTSANCTPLGAVINATAITANNVFGAADSISVEASSVTAFVEGEGVLLIVLA